MTPAQQQALTLIQGIPEIASYAVEPKQWELMDYLVVIASQYYQDVSQYDSSDELYTLATKFQLSIVGIYGHHHQSDESSELTMLLQAGIPIAAWKKIGDLSDYSHGLVIFNETQGKALAKEAWLLLKQPEEIAQESIDVLKWVFDGNPYLIPLTGIENEPIAYVLSSPHWKSGPLDCKTDRLFVLNEDNILESIAEMRGHNKSENPYREDSFHRSTVLLKSGAEKEVDTHTIVVMPVREL